VEVFEIVVLTVVAVVDDVAIVVSAASAWRDA
jgi:hypothetical protein